MKQQLMKKLPTLFKSTYIILYLYIFKHIVYIYYQSKDEDQLPAGRELLLYSAYSIGIYISISLSFNLSHFLSNKINSFCPLHLLQLHTHSIVDPVSLSLPKRVVQLPYL